mmetsp:Transcript_64186/g.150664  ORF Transcript_64186/g.150664 Transcript_64186/m.150664 type:complete len:268 (-) Transcript_64186:211-1014(-)
MSAKALNLLAECNPHKAASASNVVTGTLRWSSSVAPAIVPAPPPGLELVPTPNAISQPTLEESSETGEASYSSGSTYLDDSELSSLPTDGRFWGSTFPVETEPVSWGGVQSTILATTPYCPPPMDYSMTPTMGGSWLTDHGFQPDMRNNAYVAESLDMEGSSSPIKLPQVPQTQLPISSPIFVSIEPMDAPGSMPTGAQSATMGSAGHDEGNCKPCAFVYTKGCQSGMQCAFCHLCPPGEKDRRKKVKHIMARIRRRGKPTAGSIHA